MLPFLFELHNQRPKVEGRSMYWPKIWSASVASEANTGQPRSFLSFW